MKFSVPTIAMLASSASIASATTIVKTYIASPATSNNSTATDSGSGSRLFDNRDLENRHLSDKSGKSKSGKANPTGSVSYTVCRQALSIQFTTSSDLGFPSFPFIPQSLNIEYDFFGGAFIKSSLEGILGCSFFNITNPVCNVDGPLAAGGYATVSFTSIISSAYAEATGANPLEFTAVGGKFEDQIIQDEIITTAGEGLITTYSLKCADPAVTMFDTKEGLHPANICFFELGIQNTELDLISETEATVSLYEESAGVECGILNEV